MTIKDDQPFGASAHDGAEEDGLRPGSILQQRYVVERELGRGGVGAVYLAHDLTMESRQVVIKVLLGEVEDESQRDWIERHFKLEIAVLAKLNHPGIVWALDAGVTPGGKQYLVMQFVEGVNLRSVMKPGGMDLTRVANIVRQVGKALSAAHEKGICHRDLKPENIMLQSGEDEEYAKLIDFGIASIRDSQTTTSEVKTSIAGTLLYMAPEQLRGNPCATSDIYALGVIAYEMITGQRPFNPTGLLLDMMDSLPKLQQAGVKIKPASLRADLPKAAQEVILKALSFAAEDRYQRAREFTDKLADALTAKVGGEVITLPIPQPPEAQAMKVVLLYKRNAQPDEELLRFIEEQLRARGYSVFIDRHLTIGVEWAIEIKKQVQSADVVIPLLSEASVSSEMLAYEVEIAHHAAQARKGKPYLAPIRVKFDGALPFPLESFLKPIHHAEWKSPADNQRLIAELLAFMDAPPMPTQRVGQSIDEVLVGRPKPNTIAQLEPVGGAVPLASPFYITRVTDGEFHSAIDRQDCIVLVKGARQMGKTSLLARGLQRARAANSLTVFTDLQTLNASQLESVDAFLRTLAELICEQLNLEVDPDQVWQPHKGPNMNFESYLKKQVLNKISTPLVWGLDEVDRLFTCAYGSEVFGLFRSWWNKRAIDPTGVWQRLTLVISYATEAHLFITDLNQSPFNVGTRLELKDFTIEQVGDLNLRYGSLLRGRAELEQYFQMVNGHPYLVRRGFYEMVRRNEETERLDRRAVKEELDSFAAFKAHADRDDGPFGDHLRRILVLLGHDEQLRNAMKKVLQGEPCPTNESYFRLRGAGVITGDTVGDARPRCELYATYLSRHLQ